MGTREWIFKKYQNKTATLKLIGKFNIDYLWDNIRVILKITKNSKTNNFGKFSQSKFLIV